MEKIDQNQISEWVKERTAYLDPPPEWKPDAAAALTRFQARVRSQERRIAWKGWPAWVAAAALVFAVIGLLPATRAKAQQLWQFLTVRHVAFVSVNPWPEGVPSPKVNVIGAVIPPIPVRDREQARWRVQYDPRLPGPGVLSDSPRLSTTFSVAAGFVVKVADLELALRATGVTDQTVPPQWDGAQLALHTSALVIAEWPGLVLVQSLPLTLTAPPGFNFPAYSALILLGLGVAPEEARRLAERAGTATPWLAPIVRDFQSSADLEEVQLASGPATLLQESGKNGTTKRVTMTWSAPDRVYLLSGTLPRELIIAAANAIR